MMMEVINVASLSVVVVPLMLKTQMFIQNITADIITLEQIADMGERSFDTEGRPSRPRLIKPFSISEIDRGTNMLFHFISKNVLNGKRLISSCHTT